MGGCIPTLSIFNRKLYKHGSLGKPMNAEALIRWKCIRCKHSNKTRKTLEDIAQAATGSLTDLWFHCNECDSWLKLEEIL